MSNVYLATWATMSGSSGSIVGSNARKIELDIKAILRGNLTPKERGFWNIYKEGEEIFSGSLVKN